MPTPAFCYIEGAVQGTITENTNTAESIGNTWIQGHENEILVQAFKHTVMRPRDPQSGQPTGQRVHQPVTLTKVFDRSSPMLYQALVRGESLPVVEIKWYRTSTDGLQEHYFTHKLTDAMIVDITASMPHCQDPANASFTHLEDVTISYREIEWTHEVASTSGHDDWRAPSEA